MFWERELARFLVSKYQLNRTQAAELALHPYAFPRGRVVKSSAGFAFYHGDDFSAFANRRAIEHNFSVYKGATWRFDDHERCQALDRDAVIKILQLKQTWPAASE